MSQRTDFIEQIAPIIQTYAAAYGIRHRDYKGLIECEYII